MLQQEARSAESLGEKLAAARKRAFVGRSEEVGLFQRALAGEFSILFIHGPGGIGKSSLLAEFERTTREEGLSCLALDARSLEPTPAGFLGAIADGLALQEGSSPLAALLETSPAALLVDTYESLRPLDGWFRTEFLPRLPAATVVVLASRTPPAPEWRTDAGLGSLTRVLPLRNLTPEESCEYLYKRGLPEGKHESVLRFTHGHPLALCLVADLEAGSTTDPQSRFEVAPNVISDLLQRFVEHVPSKLHREALEVCAHARVTTEPLLAHALGVEDGHELFQWLRGLSFVEHGSEGLFPHDLARDVLDFDLRWRNPGRYRELHRRVRDFSLSRFREGDRLGRYQASLDKLFMHRYSPLLSPYFEWQAFESASVDQATSADHAFILEAVQRHEGEESARVAAYWLKRQPSAFQVFRSASGRVFGFTSGLVLEDLTEEDLAADPGIASIWSFVTRAGRLRAGERTSVQRFWMGRESYQDTYVQSFTAMAATLSWMSTPNLAWAFAAGITDADYWAPMFAYINFQPIPEADFEVGGRRYGVFGHDWRVEPVSRWLDALGERELDVGLDLETLKRSAPAPLVVLSEPDFEEAVRQAFRDYSRPAALASSPLLRSRLVAEVAANDGGLGELQSLLREAVESLKGNPRDEKLYRALWKTFIQAAPTQEAAAEALGLPFSTYRYHLTRGLERATAWLWQRELNGAGAGVP
jgi:hypothetical protein